MHSLNRLWAPALVTVVLRATAVQAADEPQASLTLQIESQPLRTALSEFGRQSGLQVVFIQTDIGASVMAPPLEGTYSAKAALDRLLANTQLKYEFINARTVAVRAPHALAQDGQKPLSSSSVGELGNGEGAFSLHLAQSDSSAPSGSGDTAGTQGVINRSNAQEGTKLEEVIVTAEKREERLQDVPVSVTVLNPQTLAENGQNRLVDYFSTVPGLNVATGGGGGGTNYLTIRGLSAGLVQNSTVATVIDDIPVVPSTSLSFGNITAPDLDPSDLARIEVLRGPQGTLYGADSIGGLIKYVTVDPSTQSFSGRVEIAGVDIPNGGLGYAVRGAANLPVSDQFAIRGSAFYREDPGYIDYLSTQVTPPDLTSPLSFELAKKNFNSSDTYGGRVSTLWHPSTDFSLKLSASLQETQGGVSWVNSDSSLQFPQGDLKYTSLPGSNQYYTQLQLYSAVLNAKVAGIDVTSLTGYALSKLENWVDTTAGLGVFTESYSNGAFGAPNFYRFDNDKVSQELRLSSTIGRLDWRIGGFYTHENSPDASGALYAANLTSGALGPLVFNQNNNVVTLKEYAAFADVTAHFTDRFEVQLGGRKSWIDQAQQTTLTGLSTHDITGVYPPDVQPKFAVKGNAFTYLVAPTFKISPDLMVYARVASGYRIGGSNTASVLAVVAGVPPTYAPDKTTNYELGVKGDLLDHRMSFDAAAYYINWSHFQINLAKLYTANGIQISDDYVSNAGDAKSEGVEFSFQARPTRGLTLTAEGAYDNAVLTQNLPAASTAYGLAGDRLPYSMRFSGGLTANQDIRLTHDWMGFIGGSVNYVGARPWEFSSVPAPGQPAPPRIEFPSYTQFNLRAGARRESWLINLYVNNVADRRGVVGVFSSSALGVTGNYYASVIQPRTIGLSASKTF